MTAQLFLQKVVIKSSASEDCWIWNGAQGSDGYGRVRRSGKTFSAHRYAYSLFKGPIPQGLCVLHECDTPLCVNPVHLFLGTMRDNSADMLRKGRQGFSGRKLDGDQVWEIRERIEQGENKACDCGELRSLPFYGARYRERRPLRSTRREAAALVV